MSLMYHHYRCINGTGLPPPPPVVPKIEVHYTEAENGTESGTSSSIQSLLDIKDKMVELIAMLTDFVQGWEDLLLRDEFGALNNNL